MQNKSNHSRELRKFLAGMKFPADKNQLVAYAEQRQASSEILNLLQQLLTSEFGSPNAIQMTQYNSLDELIREVEKVEPSK